MQKEEIESLIGERLQKQGYEVGLVNRFPNLLDIDETVMMGTFSWMFQGSRQKLILKRWAMPVGGTWTTPGSYSRQYLSVKFPTYKMVMLSEQWDKLYHDMRAAAHYCKPGLHGDCVYLDVKSAYWSIMKIVGWKPDYNPGKWLARNGDVSDFPRPENKVARNSMVSAGLIPSRLVFWMDGKSVIKKQYNRLANVAVWAVCHDVLHGIARFAIDHCNAAYVNTDGFIVPTKHEQRLRDHIESWGLPVSEKGRGGTEVKGPNAYRIGLQYTSHWSRVGYSKPLDNIRNMDYNWLRQRIFKFASFST